MKKTKKKTDWEQASWEGNRIAQLKRSLQLTPRQRFEALEDLIETSNWLARAKSGGNLKSQ